MISYREKQLLATMKFLQDETNDLSEQLNAAIVASENGKSYKFDFSNTQPAESYEDLVQLAEEAGYDCYIRADDILTPEEIADLELRKDEIEEQFRKITKLHPADYGFLATAIALQIIRQAIQPALDFESLDPQRREGHDTAAKNTDKSKAEEKLKEALDDAENRGIDPTKSKKYYYAPLSEIVDITRGVPYDAIIKGLSGKTHRFKTLGHDPVLGYLFGTCNILTDTLTTSDMKTVLIKNFKKYADGNTRLMFECSKNRYEEKGGKLVVAAAIAKQVYHIKSDQKSKAGIGIPFLQLICDEKTIRGLCNQGIDYNALEFIGTIAKQSIYSEMINFIVAISHRLLIAKEEYDKFCKYNCISDTETLMSVLKQKNLHDYIFGDKKLTEVRTRKILLTSNAVASCANVIYVGVASVASTYAGNGEGVYKALSKLDVGGILVTVWHLLSDGRIIAKIKDDFIKSAINDEFQHRLHEIEEKLSNVSNDIQ